MNKEKKQLDTENASTESVSRLEISDFINTSHRSYLDGLRYTVSCISVNCSGSKHAFFLFFFFKPLMSASQKILLINFDLEVFARCRRIRLHGLAHVFQPPGPASNFFFQLTQRRRPVIWWCLAQCVWEWKGSAKMGSCLSEINRPFRFVFS